MKKEKKTETVLAKTANKINLKKKYNKHEKEKKKSIHFNELLDYHIYKTQPE